MDKKYPIKPVNLDTSKKPKGFDNLLDYDEIILLWSFVQFWQAKGEWCPFTHDEFQCFIDDDGSKVNDSIRVPIIRFVGKKLGALLDREINDDDKNKITYHPTHYLISTYFHWNPNVQ